MHSFNRSITSKVSEYSRTWSAHHEHELPTCLIDQATLENEGE